MKKKISVVISAYNEEENIKECLQSVLWADEIILVNNSSTDKTAEVAEKMGAMLFKRPNLQMLNTNKNYGFTKASCKWILNLDADERVSPELKEEILKAISRDSTADAYLLPRKNIIFGKWIKHSLWWPDYQLRLFKKGKARFEEKHIHEKIETNGKIAKLKNPLLHYNYKSISQYIYKMDSIYTDNESSILAKGKLDWQEAFNRPLNDFLKTYLSLKGYQDGLHGIVLSILQSFYSFIVFAKAWEKQGFQHMDMQKTFPEINRVLAKFSKDYKYWFYQQKIDQSKNFFTRFFWKLVRKIKISI